MPGIFDFLAGGQPFMGQNSFMGPSPFPAAPPVAFMDLFRNYYNNLRMNPFMGQRPGDTLFAQPVPMGQPQRQQQPIMGSAPMVPYGLQVAATHTTLPQQVMDRYPSLSGISVGSPKPAFTSPAQSVGATGNNYSRRMF